MCKCLLGLNCGTSKKNRMGIQSSKVWIPPNGFEQICKEQGFQAISPPIYRTRKSIHSVDLSNENRIYYVERSTKANFPILAKQDANLELNKQSGTLVLIRKEGPEYSVLELELRLDTGDIYVQSVAGNYVLQRSYYSHEHFPKYTKTANKEYNRLRSVFVSNLYSPMETIERT